MKTNCGYATIERISVDSLENRYSGKPSERIYLTVAVRMLVRRELADEAGDALLEEAARQCERVPELVYEPLPQVAGNKDSDNKD